MKNEITKDQIPLAYEMSKNAFEGLISQKNAKDKLVEVHNMNRNSANDFIYVFKYLMQGKGFQRGLNAYAFDYFLKSIKKDYGIPKLKIALKALSEYIDYHKSKKTSKVGKIYIKYENLTKPEFEEEDFISELLKSNNPIKNAENYLKTEKFESKRLESKFKHYSRNNLAIAAIKLLRGQKCQICSYTLKKPNGSYYIEAAHIDSKKVKGRETRDNIILLCPNHHKEFDLLERIIIKRNKKSITFELNNVNHNLKL